MGLIDMHKQALETQVFMYRCTGLIDMHKQPLKTKIFMCRCTGGTGRMYRNNPLKTQMFMYRCTGGTGRMYRNNAVKSAMRCDGTNRHAQTAPRDPSCYTFGKQGEHSTCTELSFGTAILAAKTAVGGEEWRRKCFQAGWYACFIDFTRDAQRVSVACGTVRSTRAWT
ncbi:hypothetical protein J6590_043783 [Homalodisca vitripennis]|nr:hypothetical protein J6590_043783 [Homalodisca vitripennis]